MAVTNIGVLSIQIVLRTMWLDRIIEGVEREQLQGPSGVPTKEWPRGGRAGLEERVMGC